MGILCRLDYIRQGSACIGVLAGRKLCAVQHARLTEEA